MGYRNFTVIHLLAALSRSGNSFANGTHLSPSVCSLERVESRLDMEGLTTTHPGHESSGTRVTRSSVNVPIEKGAFRFDVIPESQSLPIISSFWNRSSIPSRASELLLVVKHPLKSQSSRGLEGSAKTSVDKVPPLVMLPRRLTRANHTHDDPPFQHPLIQIDGTADQQQGVQQHRNNAGIPLY